MDGYEKEYWRDEPPGAPLSYVKDLITDLIMDLDGEDFDSSELKE